MATGTCGKEKNRGALPWGISSADLKNQSVPRFTERSGRIFNNILYLAPASIHDLISPTSCAERT